MEAEAMNQQELNQIASDSEDEELNYNPKNLPLGWDGKPIPYWLYKLHGLGIEYKCEICGNYSYWGRTVSYTHLTLPTICSVQISVVAVSLKKKKKIRPTDKVQIRENNQIK
eukprot:TRINITY_DN5871_c0_g1_i3.p2 TRINITY_DN5871_c0_g1~~TRINITY_DN5871_c0_g1_i3.p2  ORF type:complete len:112 (+),score=29.90 TRINITY_DN5871_c0_g1_i3:347-682(+)